MNLAVGFFDGVHLGHQRILARADAALTFKDHPAAVFAPARVPPLLMTRATRLRTIGGGRDAAAHEIAAGHVRRVCALDFTAEMAAQTPVDFAAWLRAAYPDLETIFCGANWTFGAGGKGNADFLRARGFRVEVVPYAEVAGEPVSSTRIRAAVAAGQLERAAEMLGRPWALEGEVTAGKGLGRELGFPTLNVRPAAGLVAPPCGVYAVETPFGRGLANYGHAPTLGPRAWRTPVLEVHLLAAPPDAVRPAPSAVPSVRSSDALPAPGESVAVSLLHFIRPERRFASLAELRAQIARDVRAV